ncbi:hypothetical protein [Hirschia litorea]|uniref:DUF3742 family protein n=1 Tax=Hirschia litorea TaxID=1199156 RepID=A0ABW2ILB5_9PROT
MTLSASTHDFFSRFAFYIRRFSGWIARAGFGFFVVFAAGAALVATTFIGLLIAMAAVFLNLAVRVTRGSRGSETMRESGAGFSSSAKAHVFGAQKQSQSKKSSSGETLEAHKTADGWVIEPDA